MKKNLLAIGCMALVPLISLVLTQAARSQTAAQPQATANGVTAPTAVTEKAFFNQYCVVCHNEKAKKAGQPAALAITIDSLDVAHVEQNAQDWERVVRKVRAGMMPPA